jgi:hypothetical protein
MSNNDVLGSIYTPADAARYTVNRLKYMATPEYRQSLVDINVAGMGGYIAPLGAGSLTSVIAQTSNYKSGFIHYTERAIAKRLADQGKDDHIVIHVSVEESIEEQIHLELAREGIQDPTRLAMGEIQNWDDLEEAAIRVGAIPIYRIGDSLTKDIESPNLTMTNMIKAIDHLTTVQLAKPPVVAAIFFDYLQAFPLDPELRSQNQEGSRRLQIRDDIFKLRDVAKKYLCPVVVGVQAKQNLQGANPPLMIPGNYDGEESSSIAQRSDRIISLWLPKTTHRVGSIISTDSLRFRVEEDLLFLRVGKQRGGFPAGQSFPCRVNYVANEIAVIDYKEISI